MAPDVLSDGSTTACMTFRLLGFRPSIKSLPPASGWASVNRRSYIRISAATPSFTLTQVMTPLTLTESLPGVPLLVSFMVGDNYLGRRVASRRNVTRWMDVVFPVFVSRHGSNGADADVQGRPVHPCRTGALDRQALRNDPQEDTQHHVESSPVALHEVAQPLWYRQHPLNDPR